MLVRTRSPERGAHSPLRFDANGESAGMALWRGHFMLDEHMTLTILGWTLGTVCIGTLVMSALSLQ